VNLTAQLKLEPTAEQGAVLSRTLAACNAACNYVSGVAWESKTFRQFDLHRLCYREARNLFGVSAQAAVRCISKVADAYKLDRKAKRTFRAMGSAAYDQRILSYDLEASTISIWSLDGRLKIPFVCGEHQRTMLANRKGETDLAHVRGKWYVLANCSAPNPKMAQPDGFLGVDLGVAQIAADSDGNLYSGSEIKSVRHRQRRLRAKLQARRTRSAKRRLQKLSGKERRFAKHVNHVISKQIVAAAERTGRGIAVEELTGIRERIRATRRQRGVLHSWAFAQLRAFLEYKAKRAGVCLVAVNPRNSSRECSLCGHTDKGNRPNQSTFRCATCGFAAHADTNAARVIAGRATVSGPNVASCAAV
jgi:IS605 OrfB family transposase